MGNGEGRIALPGRTWEAFEQTDKGNYETSNTDRVISCQNLAQGSLHGGQRQRHPTQLPTAVCLRVAAAAINLQQQPLQGPVES